MPSIPVNPSIYQNQFNYVAVASDGLDGITITQGHHGVTMATGDFVLLYDMSTEADNGIYVITGPGSGADLIIAKCDKRYENDTYLALCGPDDSVNGNILFSGNYSTGHVGAIADASDIIDIMSDLVALDADISTVEASVATLNSNLTAFQTATGYKFSPTMLPRLTPVAITSNGQAMTGTATKADGTTYAFNARSFRPVAAPNTLEINASYQLRVVGANGNVDADSYSSTTENAPGVKIAIPQALSNLLPGETFYLQFKASIDQPTYMSSGKAMRPFITFFGQAMGDGGNRSKLMIYIEANGGNYRVGGVYYIGASSGTIATITVTSANLITGIEMRLKYASDGSFWYEYRVVGSSTWIPSVVVNTYQPFIPQEIYQGIAYLGLSGMAGNITALNEIQAVGRL